MKKTVALLTICGILMSLFVPAPVFAAEVRTLAQKMTFDDMTELRVTKNDTFKASTDAGQNIAFSADWDLVADELGTCELSTEFDHTTGRGKSLKLFTNFAAGKYFFRRFKFLNVFKGSKLDASDIGSSYTISAWVYAKKETKIIAGIMSLVNVEGMGWTDGLANGWASAMYKNNLRGSSEFVIPAGKWTKISQTVTLDETHTHDKFQVALWTIELPDNDTEPLEIWMDDVQVKDASVVEYEDAVSEINTKAPSIYSYEDIDLYGEEGARTKRLLSSINLFGDFFYKYEKDKPLTRGEFAAYLSDFIQDADSVAAQNPYTDLAVDINKNKILALSNLGIMKGYDDSTFASSAEIILDEAVTAMLKLLNYEPYAELRGGYPNGYRNTAYKLDLLDGIDASGDSKVTYELFLKLVGNLIDIDVLEQVTYGETADYKTTEDYTILAQNFDIYKDEGVVSSNEITSLSSSAPLPDGQTKINDTVFTVGKSDVNSHLGYNTVYYYRYSSMGKSEIVYAYRSENNEITEVDAEDVKGLNGSKFEYYSGQKVKSETITGSESYIYNGIYKVPSAGIFNIDNGRITLVDNDSDGKTEVIFIDDVKHYVVSTVDSDGVIYNKYADPLKVDFKDSEVKVSVSDTDGKVISLDKLKEWDVLSVKQSDKNEIQNFEIVVSRYTAQGRIGEISYSGSEYDYFTIDGTVIKAAGTLNKLTFGSEPKLSEVSSDKPVIFLLDENGKAVAWRDFSTKDFSVGYLMDVDYSSGLNKDLMLRILTSGNKISEFKTADRVVLDGTKYKNTDSALANALINGGETKRQVISYKIDNTKNITHIDTADSGTLPEGNDTLHLLTQGTFYYSKWGNYMNANTQNGKTFSLSEDTVAFRVPASSQYEDDDDYYVAFGNLPNTLESQGSYYVEMYTTGSMYNLADIVVIKKDGYALCDADTPVLVSEIRRTTDAYGSEVLQAVGYNVSDGSNVSFAFDDRRTGRFDNKISAGDFFLYSKGTSEPYIFEDGTEALEFFVDCNDTMTDTDFVLSQTKDYGETQYGHWIPYTIDGKYIVFNLVSSPGAKESLCAFEASKFNYYLVDSKNKKVEHGSVADISFFSASEDIASTSDCYVYIRSGRPVAVIVYN